MTQAKDVASLAEILPAVSGARRLPDRRLSLNNELNQVRQTVDLVTDPLSHNAVIIGSGPPRSCMAAFGVDPFLTSLGILERFAALTEPRPAPIVAVR